MYTPEIRTLPRPSGVFMTIAMRIIPRCSITAAAICLLSFVPVYAQGTLADYQRGHDLRAKAKDLVVNSPGPATWINNSDRFWYPKSVKGGTEFVLVDAEAGSKKPAFDQDRLAAAISSAVGKPYTALNLPFAPMQGRGRPMPVAFGTTAPREPGQGSASQLPAEHRHELVASVEAMETERKRAACLGIRLRRRPARQAACIRVHRRDRRPDLQDRLRGSAATRLREFHGHRGGPAG